MKREPCACGYNWATLFLGEINTGTSPSRLGESRFWESKIWSWVPRNLDLGMTSLARPSSNVNDRPVLSSERASHIKEPRSCLRVITPWSWNPDGCLAPRQTGRLTAGRNITLILTLSLTWESDSAVEGEWPLVVRPLLFSKRRPHFKTHKNLERKIWSWVPTGPKTKKDCTREGQQQFTRPDWTWESVNEKSRRLVWDGRQPGS
jgi:hypothetical protein